MRRRQYLGVLTGVLPLAGCTGGPGDPITMLAVNRDDTAHTVTVWAVRGERLEVATTVEVTSETTARLGEMPWRRGRYRVTVQVDGDVALAVRRLVQPTRRGRRRRWLGRVEPGAGGVTCERVSGRKKETGISAALDRNRTRPRRLRIERSG